MFIEETYVYYSLANHTNNKHNKSKCVVHSFLYAKFITNRTIIFYLFRNLVFSNVRFIS